MAVAINVLLLAAFAIQHTIMARPAFKQRWTRIVPQAIERSTFVLIASLLLFLMYWQWRPMTAAVWTVEGPLASVLWAVFGIGWLIVLLSTLMVGHFELFGLSQVWYQLRRAEPPVPKFREPAFYKIVIAFWATPVMTQGHLLFAAVTTVYMLVAIRIEERDLIAMLGDEYLDYRKRVPAMLPIFGSRSKD